MASLPCQALVVEEVGGGESTSLSTSVSCPGGMELTVSIMLSVLLTLTSASRSSRRRRFPGNVFLSSPWNFLFSFDYEDILGYQAADPIYYDVRYDLPEYIIRWVALSYVIKTSHGLLWLFLCNALTTYPAINNVKKLKCLHVGGF